MKKYNYSLFGNTFQQKLFHTKTSQLTCKTLQVPGFYMIQVFSKRCFRTDYKTAFVFSPLQRTHNLAWQYINYGRSINALCTFNLGHCAKNEVFH